MDIHFFENVAFEKKNACSKDDDIFSPSSSNTSNGLDGLFHQNSKKAEKSGKSSTQSLKYQAPTKNETNPKAPENPDFTPPPPIGKSKF